MLLYGIVIFILGIILLIYYPIHTAQSRRRNAEVTGTITNIQTFTERDSDGNLKENYVYTVGYTVDGNEYSVKSGRTPTEKAEGDSMNVQYNSSKPGDAHLSELHGTSSKAILIIGIIAVIIGIILLLIGIL